MWQVSFGSALIIFTVLGKSFSRVGFPEVPTKIFDDSFNEKYLGSKALKFGAYND